MNKAWDAVPRLAGALFPLFASRDNENDLGIGDTLSAPNLMRALKALGFHLWQDLPAGETDVDNSPYSPISSQALNWVSLGFAPHTVPGLSADHLAALASGTNDRSGSRVNYPAVRRTKRALLDAAFNNFEAGCLRTGADTTSYEEFLHENQWWLPQYGAFHHLFDRHGHTDWTKWGAEMQDFDSAAQALAHGSQARDYERACRFWSYVQWVSDRQWLGVRQEADALGMYMMGDIPFGISIRSVDYWAFRHLFEPGLCGGAPPEPNFAADEFTRVWGQNWGVGVYRWASHKADNYQWWRRRIERVLRYNHTFRLDHVLGFFRFYSFNWAPALNSEVVKLPKNDVVNRFGMPGFLPGPDEGEQAKTNCHAGTSILQDILSGGGLMVGEDLGTVPDYVRPALKDLGIPGFFVPWWDRLPDFSYRSLDQVAEDSVFAYATHDHPPIATSYATMLKRWKGSDGHAGWCELQHLMRHLGLDPEQPPTQYDWEAHRAFLRTGLDSKARLAIYTIVDWLGLDGPEFNQPGTANDSNWSARMPMSMEGYAQHSDFAAKLSAISAMIRKSGR